MNINERVFEIYLETICSTYIFIFLYVFSFQPPKSPKWGTLIL
jgi:hypothetical protein